VSFGRPGSTQGSPALSDAAASWPGTVEVGDIAER
jgi:hypothetical protein